MRFGIVVFPGSNCDRDCHHVVTRVLGCEATYLWHRDATISDVDALIIPGGFSYGDYLRTGAVAKLSPVMDEVRRFANRGGPVLGICNGFQILLESGLLPGAMLRNRNLRFICKDVELEVASARTAWTSGYAEGQKIRLPIAHAEGNYALDSDGLKRLEDEGQVVMRYVDNPNGSSGDIAGICSSGRNVVGLMPHPERAAERDLGRTDGRPFFESVLAAVGGV